ncbi:MAG: GNAT family N-acetyltransferase [Pseudomonadota bacterium]
MKPTIELCDFRMRPTGAGDAGFLLRLLTTPEVRRYLCDNRVLGGDEISGILADSRHHDSKGLGVWVVEAEHGEPVGIVGLAPVSGPLEFLPDMTGKIEPTIALDPRYWGRGLAKTALLAVVRYACVTLGLSKLVASVDEPNEDSHRLLTACGFERSGTVAGIAYDLVVYEISFDRSGMRGGCS